ncbi:hypothetical protein OHA77_21570 [Streptosporangium sp. NBC_01639]|uniref:hypothetical protein n=1 Tax=Streptosporangium sp. NBC_01639 TaxID=2975948 RepID=UPI00386FC7E2|nr:hypothetical protein OHA77_21570 [Streptosporangium sp. NBC_01639]
MRRARVALLGAMGATVIMTSACGGAGTEDAAVSQAAPATTGGATERTAPDTAPTETPDTEESTSPETGQAETDQAETGQAETAEAATAAGTGLKVGDRAVLPYKEGTVGVTVTAVEAGDQQAFEQRYGTRAKGIVPYYIRYTVENVDGRKLAFMSAPYLQLLTADGRSTGAIVSGTTDDCRRESAPKDFTRAGATFETCKLAGAAAGVKIAGAKFDEGDYRKNPVTWRR